MKKFIPIFLSFFLLTTCKKNTARDRLMYSITYIVEANGGAEINYINYRNENGDLVELFNVPSPWRVDLRVRAGLALEARATGNIPTGDHLSITAIWCPDGWFCQSEKETLPNNIPNSTISNGSVIISGRTLWD